MADLKIDETVKVVEGVLSYGGKCGELKIITDRYPYNHGVVLEGRKERLWFARDELRRDTSGSKH